MSVSRSNRKTRARRATAILLLAAVLGILAAAAMAEFGWRWWVFDLFAHFRWHYLAFALAAALLALGRGAHGLAVAATLAGAAHVPAMIDAPDAIAPRAPAERIEFAITTSNVWWRSDKLDNLLGRIKVAEPDVVVLQEVHGHWHRAIESLRARYPHVAPANWRESGVVVLSKHAVRASRADHYTVTADIDVKGRTIRVVGVHLPTPLSASTWRAQQAALDRIAHDSLAARAAGMAFVAAGDFNLTPYSPRFARFLAASGLRRAPVAGFWPATWPAASGLKYGGPFWRGLEIDHVLVGPEFALVGAFRGPDIGSDHFPVHATLKFVR